MSSQIETGLRVGDSVLLNIDGTFSDRPSLSLNLAPVKHHTSSLSLSVSQPLCLSFTVSAASQPQSLSLSVWSRASISEPRSRSHPQCFSLSCTVSSLLLGGTGFLVCLPDIQGNRLFFESPSEDSTTDTPHDITSGVFLIWRPGYYDNLSKLHKLEASANKDVPPGARSWQFTHSQNTTFMCGRFTRSCRK